MDLSNELFIRRVLSTGEDGHPLVALRWRGWGLCCLNASRKLTPFEIGPTTVRQRLSLL